MKNIGPTGKSATPLSSKKNNRVNDQFNATKKHYSNDLQTGQVEELNRQALKILIHKKLQDIDLSNPEGRQLGREVFMELSLKQEFGDQHPDFLYQHQLISKIENGIFQDSSMRRQLDNLIKTLKKSV